ncbi:hypothetical protein [Actinomycetia phage DSL-LC01]|nr:hypothetical protein [Actinomycetia phage DSL-LC01]
MHEGYDYDAVNSDAKNVVNLLEGLLERVENIFESYNVPLPGRKYWTVGQDAIDCEQLVVVLNQLYLGPPGDQAATPQRCHVPRTAVMTVSLSRSIPSVGQNGRPPSAETIQNAARLAAVDAWVMMESVNALDMWDGTGLGVGVIATVDVPPPEGGFQTVNMQLTMSVP